MTTTILDQAQTEANELEGIITADMATLELIADLKAVKRHKAEVEAEEKMLSELLKEQMLKNGVKHYTDTLGVELTTLSARNNSRFDKASAIKKLGADVIAEFTSTSTSYTLTIKG